MTFEEKMAAIDRYFDNITSEDFNRILEEKYGVPRNVDVEEGVLASNDACDMNIRRDPDKSSISPRKSALPPVKVKIRPVIEDVGACFDDAGDKLRMSMQRLEKPLRTCLKKIC